MRSLYPAAKLPASDRIPYRGGSLTSENSEKLHVRTPVLDATPSAPCRLDVARRGANFALAILAAIAIHAGIWLKVFEHPQTANFTHIVDGAAPGLFSGLALFASVTFSLNLLMGCFNLVPMPPLDGFAAMGLLLSEESAGRFQKFGQQLRGFSMIGLVIAWQVFDPIFNPIFTLSLRALYPGYGYGS